MEDCERVILLGLDGLGRAEIQSFLTPESLTVLEDTLQTGCYADLKSTNPPWTPCAWPSFLSGRNPGKHGVFDFFTNNGYDKNLIDRSSVDSPTLFEVADQTGITPIAVNYPVTHPSPDLDNGAVVPGYLATEDVEFSPSQLREEYEDEYGKYVIYPEYGADSDAVQEYTRVARHRRDMARFLDTRYEWDLMAVQFQVTDSIFHDLDDREKIRQVLENVDDFVGDIINLGDDDTNVFIASDHGMGDYEWTFYVNSWLAENGYCETTTGEEQYFRQAKDELKGESGEKGPSSIVSAVGAAASALSAVGLSPRRIHQGLGTVGLDKTVERLLPEDALVAAQNQVVDHENSVAYQLLFNSLGVHLNVEGRESNGQVSPEEYDDVREELINDLSQVRDPDGNLVFDDVLPREEVYEGKHLEDAPDIVLVPRDYQYDVSGSIVDTFRRYPHKNHKPEGILISNRDLDIDPETGASIYDVAPTVAAALGLPVDSETDGEVLGPFEADERVDWDELAGEYREVADSESGPTDDVEDRLADLGYME
ncbi:alkaline phosphatase family protein [Haloarcula hispanica]|uniref:Nucleotide pyrophosphatase n=1 Tax=Haloarcula hispanica TaxID=51589 RepID=A0A482T004_HALHI|nr:alkaline phosphatase family protein [Haloarcula hispanica]MCJ0618971.1 alkaline phosphatase family protein [Haloarcula hispanica]RYJ09504.1 nucleotide pyrophosphatase [Haloarcula hispanica]